VRKRDWCNGGTHDRSVSIYCVRNWRLFPAISLCGGEQESNLRRLSQRIYSSLKLVISSVFRLMSAGEMRSDRLKFAQLGTRGYPGERLLHLDLTGRLRRAAGGALYRPAAWNCHFHSVRLIGSL
jgi:hypothetical protein